MKSKVLLSPWTWFMLFLLLGSIFIAIDAKTQAESFIAGFCIGGCFIAFLDALVADITNRGDS